MATKTQITLVAVFPSTAEAETAAEELQAIGVHRDRILVTSTNAANVYQPSSHTGRYRQSGIKGWWHSLFGEDENVSDRNRYEDAVKRGNVLLSVDTTDQNESDVAEIINRHSPINLHEEGPNTGTTRATSEVVGNSIPTHITIPEETPQKEPPAPGATAAQGGAAVPVAMGDTARTGNADTVPVAKEELKVDTRQVLRGGVRVYARVVEQPIEEKIRLRDEHVRVERRKVDRPAPEADLRPGQEQVIEVKEFGEVPLISKQVRVVEEIRVNKEFSDRVETIRDTVRRTQVDIQPIRGDQTAGETASEAAWRFDPDTEEAFRRDYEAKYKSSGQPYDYYAAAYRFGYAMANEPRYRNRRFEEVESDLRREYGQRNPDEAWDRLRNSVRYGWSVLTNRI
ncbi:MAG TPA: YsnF/AvaK domain-containing protein [Bryobacteraceae bacterium]|jgi:stress response protein YsnF|nr:YsnF/AvaK domain-containing protein [Bryobacteraceae bacterium]